MVDVSSRTPEGSPNICPVCGYRVVIEPSVSTGDATCPHCGSLLWFYHDAEGTAFFEAGQIALVHDEIDALIAFMNAGMDSLEVIELVMELEEEFDITISEADAQQIQTVPDAIRYLLKYRSSN